MLKRSARLKENATVNRSRTLSVKNAKFQDVVFT